MKDDRLLLQVIVASTRPARKGRAVADWFTARAQAHGAFDVEDVDLARVGLPFYDETLHPRLRQYEHEHTRAWSAVVDRADAYVVVLPEYDHGPPAALTNALQFLLHEWAYKPMGFVSYGGVSGGTRSVQMVKQIAVALKMMPMFEAVSIPFFAQYINQDTGIFDPPQMQADAAATMLAELHRWAVALRPMRRSG
jgi:NAD(P)H-dependent FMN reductase